MPWVPWLAVRDLAPLSGARPLSPRRGGPVLCLGLGFDVGLGFYWDRLINGSDASGANQPCSLVFPRPGCVMLHFVRGTGCIHVCGCTVGLGPGTRTPKHVNKPRPPSLIVVVQMRGGRKGTGHYRISLPWSVAWFLFLLLFPGSFSVLMCVFAIPESNGCFLSMDSNDRLCASIQFG